MSASKTDVLHAEVEAVARRLRLPYLRKAAAEVRPTAKAQRWEPAEIIRVLLTEEAAGRDAATIRNRRRLLIRPRVAAPVPRRRACPSRCRSSC